MRPQIRGPENEGKVTTLIAWGSPLASARAENGQARSALSLCATFHHGICKSAFILALTCSMTSALTAAFFLARRIFQSRDFT